MAKSQATKDIEELLYIMVKNKRLYGCSEVTIGFYNNGHGNEIVDFCTMDSKGIIKCYEIKVSMSDFKSKAKKSWYGHYNYLVVTKELYDKLTDDLINTYLPNFVGIMIPDRWSDTGFSIVKRSKKQDISTDTEIMMKESLVRTLSYKVTKIRNSNNLSLLSSLKSEIARLNRKLNEVTNKYQSLLFHVQLFERFLNRNYNYNFKLEDLSKYTDRKLPNEINLKLSESGKKRNSMIKGEC